MGFLRNLFGRVEWQTPPAEPHCDDLGLDVLFPPVPEKVTRQLLALDDTVERRIANYDRAIQDLRANGDLWAVDVMLDARNNVRPPRVAGAPVSPGRPS